MVATTVVTLVSTGLLEGPDAFMTGFNAETDYDAPGAAKDRLFPKVSEVDPLQRLYEPQGLAARWSEADDRAFMAGFDENVQGRTVFSQADQQREMLEFNESRAYNEENGEGIGSFSLRFLSNRDSVYNNMENVDPLDGYEDVACHADPYSFGFVDPDTGMEVQEADARMFARLLKDSGKYQGKPIRLIACEAGKLQDGLAQQLANELGVEVLAPTKPVYLNSQGSMVLADDEAMARDLLRKATKKWSLEGWIRFRAK